MLNLRRLVNEDVDGNERETLILQNRTIREEHPEIDELLGGLLGTAPDYTAREAATNFKLVSLTIVADRTARALGIPLKDVSGSINVSRLGTMRLNDRPLKRGLARGRRRRSRLIGDTRPGGQSGRCVPLMSSTRR